MDYSFVRKLVKEVSKEEGQKIYEALASNGIEVFVQKNDEYHNMNPENFEENVEFYVTAADLAFARELIQKMGLNQYLCSEAEVNVNVQKSEVEKAEEELYRKHRQNQMLAWGIIIFVIVFIVFQFLMNR